MGSTPAHAAAYHGHVECLRLLLDSNADPNSLTEARVFRSL